MKKAIKIEGRIVRAYYADIINPISGKIIRKTDKFDDICKLMARLTCIASQVQIITFTIHETLSLK